jgi:NADH-quinone oxidoreductase subunit J
MIWTTLFFIALAVVVIGTGIGTLLSRNAIYAALFLVANFTMVAILYLVLGAPFIALSQVTVYAGAIMVLFLFVIMLLGAEKLPGTEPMKVQRWLGVPLAVFLFLQAIFLVVFAWTSQAPLPEPPAGYASPALVASDLFTRYALPFEITSVILLVAVIGAIALTRGEAPLIRSSLLRRGKPAPKDEDSSQ